jgi:hypothetical protein
MALWHRPEANLSKLVMSVSLPLLASRNKIQAAGRFSATFHQFLISAEFGLDAQGAAAFIPAV